MEPINNRLLRAKDVEELTKFKIDWIYKQIALGKFPKPIKIGRSSRWSYLAIKQWLDETAQKKSTPKHLLKHQSGH